MTRSGLALCVVLVALANVIAPFADVRADALPPVRIERQDEVMGSMFSVTVIGTETARLEAAADAALAEAHRLDRLLSNYQPESEWSAVNRSAATRPIVVSPELFALLEDCLRYSADSEGTFDITVGPLMKTWGFYKGEGALPAPAALVATRGLVGAGHVRLDRAARTVSFDRAGVELDPGGIGKGYAVDRMTAIVRTHGVERAFISAAGSSIYGLGAPPDEPRGWPVTIRAPHDRETIAADVFLKDMAMSTSGSYEKFFWADGRVYSHIIDPRSGFPAQGTASVSVVAPRAIDTEAWTKPYFIHGRAWTRRRKPAGTRVFFCTDSAPPACAWL